MTPHQRKIVDVIERLGSTYAYEIRQVLAESGEDVPYQRIHERLMALHRKGLIKEAKPRKGHKPDGPKSIWYELSKKGKESNTE